MLGSTLARAQRGPDEGMVPIVPCGFDQHPADMRALRFRDRALGACRTARMLRRNEADVCHQLRRACKAAGIAEFRGNR